MKVEVNIDGLERKIAICNEKVFSSGSDEQEQYWMGRADAFMDVLCGYLGVTDPIEMSKLEERIIEKYKVEEE